MRRIVILLLIAVLGCSSLQAQIGASHTHWEDRRNTLSISAGYVSGFWLSKEVLVGWIGPAASHSRHTQYYGSYGLQYYYQVKGWCRVGAKGIWEGDDYDIYSGKKDDETAYKKGKTFNHNVSLVASVQFTWLNFPHVQLYSGVDAGVGAIISDTRYDVGYADSNGNEHPIQITWLPAVNVTPLGVAFGCWSVFGFIETNVGYEGLLKAGLGVHF